MVKIEKIIQHTKYFKMSELIRIPNSDGITDYHLTCLVVLQYGVQKKSFIQCFLNSCFVEQIKKNKQSIQ